MTAPLGRFEVRKRLAAVLRKQGAHFSDIGDEIIVRDRDGSIIDHGTLWSVAARFDVITGEDAGRRYAADVERAQKL